MKPQSPVASRASIALVRGVVCLACLSGCLADSGKTYAPAIEALNKAVASGDAADIKARLAEGFALPGFPPAMQEQALEQAFAQAKGKIGALNVVEERKTRTGFDLTLQTPAGEKLEVCLDESGKFTDLKFFAVPTAPLAGTDLNVTAPPHDTIPFEISGGGLVMIRGVVNGIEGCLFVDSGAPLCVLNSDVFPDLKGEAADTQGLHGDIGNASLVNVESLTFGNIEFKNLEGLHQPLSHLRQGFLFWKPKGKLLGLIGYKELSCFEVMINYPHETISFLTLDEAGNRVAQSNLPAPKRTLPFTLSEHIPVFDCEIAGQALRMGLDTGAEANLIDLRYEETLGKLLTGKQKAMTLGADNKPVAITYGELPGLRAGGFPCSAMRTVFADISHLNSGEDGMKIDGLLGYPFLSNSRLVSINFVKKELTLW